jgi:serine/threonine-protein kinase HipA
MTDTLAVIIGDRLAGELSLGRDRRITFLYNDDYRALPDPTPLSLAMPPQLRSHPDRVVTPWLWGLLPDNDTVLARWAREFQVSASSPFGFLASPIGEDCAGAVRFVGPDRVQSMLTRPGRIKWLSEDQVADRLRDLRRDETAWLGEDFTGRFSLAGAQSKTALVFDGTRWGLPSGAAATTHILKPAVSGFDDHDLNEHLCLRAAAAAGLPAVWTEVVTFGAEKALCIERYDRIKVNKELVHIHQEDACQALGVPPSQKYQADGGPAPADIAQLLRRVMRATRADGAVQQFADALIWNWVIAGTDAHAKNYSLLLNDSQSRLAPLYDVASALPYRTHEQKLRLAMKLGNDYRLSVQRPSTWTAIASQLGLEADLLRERALELVTVAPDAFADAAKGTPLFDTDLPTRLTSLVADRAKRCRSMVRRSDTP